MRIMRALAVACLFCAPAFGQASVSPAVAPAELSVALQAQVQAATALTQSDGTFSGAWPTPFPQQPTSYVAGIPSTSNTPLICSIQYADMNGFTGKCWQLSATTLPSTTTALLGLVVSPVTNAASGQTVRIFGKQ